MKRITRPACRLLLALCGVATAGLALFLGRTGGRAPGDAPAVLADTPWPKRHHDLRNTSRSPLSGPTHGRVVWRTLISPVFGRNIMSSPAVDQQGNIYVGSQDHNLYSLTPQGKVRWRFATQHAILWSSPLLAADGTVYVASWDGFLYAVTTAGTPRWRFELRPGASQPGPSTSQASPAGILAIIGGGHVR